MISLFQMYGMSVEYADECLEVQIPPAPAPGPEVCPECHNLTPVSPDKAWSAVVAMCKGER